MGMNHTEACQRIRDNLESGRLPKEFDLTFIAVGRPQDYQNCAGCCEHFSHDEISLSLTLGLDRNTGFIESAKKSGRAVSPNAEELKLIHRLNCLH